MNWVKIWGGFGKRGEGTRTKRNCKLGAGGKLQSVPIILQFLEKRGCKKRKISRAGGTSKPKQKTVTMGCSIV